MTTRAKCTDRIKSKKERLEVFTHDLQFNKIFFDGVEKVPDNVRNHPPAAQEAFAVTFNNNLQRWGDINFAFRAAWKALQNVVDRLRHEKKQGRNSNQSSLGVMA